MAAAVRTRRGRARSTPTRTAGSTAHAAGGGTEHTNVYGGSTYGAAGAGVAHTYPSGATAYRPPVPAAVPVYPYHPPVAVSYYSSGCYGCAAAAGAVVGMAAGAAVAIPVAVYLLCLWVLHDRPEYRQTRSFGPIAAGLVLLTPFTGYAVPLVGVILTALVAVKLVLRSRQAG